MPGRVAKLEPRCRLQGGKKRRGARSGTARAKRRQTVIGGEDLHREAQVRDLENPRRAKLDRGLLNLPRSEADACPGERGLAQRQADPRFRNAPRGSAPSGQPAGVKDDRQPSSRFSAQIAHKKAEPAVDSGEQWLAGPFEEVDHDAREFPKGEAPVTVGDHAVTGLSSARRSTREISAESAPATPRNPGNELTSTTTGPCSVIMKSAPYRRRWKTRPISRVIDLHSAGSCSAEMGKSSSGACASNDVRRRAAKICRSITHTLISQPSPGTICWRTNGSSFHRATRASNSSTVWTLPTRSPR